ncbi:MAG: hypothetical protein ACLQM8_00520 [Limisphaerales bacterium]
MNALPDVSAERPVQTCLTESLFEAWVDAVDQFRRRERREIVEREPSPETLAQYRVELKMMLRSTRTLLNLAEDPDYPSPRFIPQISGKLRQLESSWESLNNPMTDPEADTLLQRVFPNEPGAGSAA